MFTFKGISSEGKLRVQSVTRTLLPTSNILLQDIEGKAGSYFVRKTHGIRPITIEAVILGDSLEDLQDRAEEVAEWLDSDKPEPLIFNDEPDRIYYAILDGTVDVDEQLKYGFITLSFTCPDPYKYGAERTENLSGTQTVTYNGTAPVYPTISVSFTDDQEFFEVSNGEDKVRVNYLFTPNSNLVIDMNKGKATVNGEKVPVSIDSDFFALKKGTNTLTVSTGTVTMTYRERFK